MSGRASATRGGLTALAVVAALASGAAACRAPSPGSGLVVGSKSFTEGVVLGEIAALVARDAGVDARHRPELGGTRVLWSALRAGDIDVYAEYTGTLSEEIFAAEVPAELEALRAALGERGLIASDPLGFANSYALGMREARAAELGIETISDLVAHPELSLGFSNEFMDRSDGWPALRGRYGLPHEDVRGLDHDLAYRAVADGAIDVTDLYSTDAEIRYYDLRVLEDDRDHFPDYRAVWVAREQLPDRLPAAWEALRRLEGRIDAGEMVAMNAEAKLEGRSASRVAADFLARELDLAVDVGTDPMTARLWRRTVEHLRLVGISLGAAILVAVPLGVVATRRRRLGQLILGAVGIIQTIPALALLVFMIPLLGIGGPPAMLALFLYSLLPIVRNTASGLADIPDSLLESADALGLPPGARMRLVELPLAARSILAGVKISAVINIGTATLGALIGAGGYGQPILTGIRLDDVALILEGAIPAALLALAAQGIFELAERLVVPRGLRLSG